MEKYLITKREKNKKIYQNIANNKRLELLKLVIYKLKLGRGWSNDT